MQDMDFTQTNTSNLAPEILKLINFGTTMMKDAAFNELAERMKLVSQWFKDTENYIKSNNLDLDVFAPMWGEHTQRMVADALFSADRNLIDRLRRIWWFSGWPTNIYTDARTFPVTDPVYQRYKKLQEFTPARFQFAAPALFGEAGWLENEKIVNHDVAILQERIQFLYFSGTTDYIDSITNPMILELGTGYGGMSLVFHQSFPGSRNILCDLPQALAVAYCYLNGAHPTADHYAVTADGIYHVNSRKLVAAEEAFNKPGAFVYLPNYLLPAHEKFLEPCMIFNAMSLHEMFPMAIKYYCELAVKLLQQHQGIFCEVNTLPGNPNVAIDGRLRENFEHCLEIDFPSLAGRPRLWSSSSSTITLIGAAYKRMHEKLPLHELFEFAGVFESPVTDDEVLRKMILDQLGRFLGPTASILPPPGEPFIGNHLRYIVQERKGVRKVSAIEVSRLNEELGAARANVTRLQAALTELQASTNQLYASRSWRYTVLIRKLATYLRVFKRYLGAAGN